MESALVNEPAEDLAPPPAATIAAAGTGARPRRVPGAGVDLAALSRGVAAGDERALAALYELWFDSAVALARSILRRTPAWATGAGGGEASLDVVQEAFIRVARRMKAMSTDADVERWMVRVIKTAALDHLRGEVRRARRHESHAMGSAGAADRPTDTAAELAEQVEWLRARLDELTPDERTLLGLRYASERTLDEAGAAAGLSGDAAHGKIRRALKRLREAAGSMFHDGP